MKAGSIITEQCPTTPDLLDRVHSGQKIVQDDLGAKHDGVGVSRGNSMGAATFNLKY